MIVTGLSAEPLDTRALCDRIRRDDCGALVVFEGTTRSPSGGREVLRLEYEAYTALAERRLRELAEEAAERFGAPGVVAMHRVGIVPVGEASVVVACAAPHRAGAFEAARWLIDTLKAEVAIWKREHFAGGESAWAAGEDAPRRA